jgi:ArsR family transcriptional regulator, arsenate/arsenite/antimonite-responsive transcriptional repressor
VRAFMAVSKALSDENRVRLVLALEGGELCLCQLVALVELAASTVSKHMTILREAGLVAGRKDGRWMYYRLPGDDAPPLVRKALAWTMEMLADHPTLVEDRRRLAEIRAAGPGPICCP